MFCVCNMQENMMEDDRTSPQNNHSVLKLSRDMVSDPPLPATVLKRNNLKVAINSLTQTSLDNINMKPGFKSTNKRAEFFHDLCNLLVIYFSKWFWMDVHWMSLLPHSPQEAPCWWCAQKSSVLTNTLECKILFIVCNYFRLSPQILLQVHCVYLKAYPPQKESYSKPYAEKNFSC